jgi:hypothetical protein
MAAKITAVGFRTPYAGGLASGGGGPVSVSGGCGREGLGEVPLRMSLGVGVVSGAVMASGGISVPTLAVSGVTTPLMPQEHRAAPLRDLVCGLGRPPRVSGYGNASSEDGGPS